MTDKFYTHPQIVDYCCQALNLTAYDLIIEPSAGAGAFLEPLRKARGPWKAYDIQPESDGIIKADYLTIPIEEIKGTSNRLLTIGNPPFGKNCSLALQFIRKAMTYSDTVAFILPRSFKKPSLQNKIPLNFVLAFTVDLPDNSFIYDGKAYSVPTVYQVWHRSLTPRVLIETPTSSTHFNFVLPRDAELSIRRVGANAGFASVDTRKAPSSHYFIALPPNSKLTPTILVEACNRIVWTHNNTTGPRSIAKGELIEEIEKQLEGQV